MFHVHIKADSVKGTLMVIHVHLVSAR